MHAQVHLLEGDLNSDNLGLSPADQAKVFTEVQFVVHSAASIELEADVQHTLRSNYQGTRRLLTMATRMTALRCFLHVSTAYVNVNQPRGTYVEERIYPLRWESELDECLSHTPLIDRACSCGWRRRATPQPRLIPGWSLASKDRHNQQRSPGPARHAGVTESC